MVKKTQEYFRTIENNRELEFWTKLRDANIMRKKQQYFEDMKTLKMKRLNIYKKVFQIGQNEGK